MAYHSKVKHLEKGCIPVSKLNHIFFSPETGATCIPVRAFSSTKGSFLFDKASQTFWVDKNIQYYENF